MQRRCRRFAQGGVRIARQPCRSGAVRDREWDEARALVCIERRVRVIATRCESEQPLRARSIGFDALHLFEARQTLRA